MMENCAIVRRGHVPSMGELGKAPSWLRQRAVGCEAVLPLYEINCSSDTRPPIQSFRWVHLWITIAIAKSQPGSQEFSYGFHIADASAPSQAESPISTVHESASERSSYWPLRWPLRKSR